MKRRGQTVLPGPALTPRPRPEEPPARRQIRPDFIVKFAGKLDEKQAEAFKKLVAACDEDETIEREASRLVRSGARQGSYGHPRGDFDTIARIWSAILTKFNGFEVKVEAEQVALCMAGLKLSRLARDPGHRDSKVDTIGYMICLDRLDEEQ